MNSGEFLIGHEVSFQAIASSMRAVLMTVQQTRLPTGQMVDSPVFIRDGKIRMKIDRMEMEKFYPVDYSGKKYLIRKTAKGVIDIYKVME